MSALLAKFRLKTEPRELSTVCQRSYNVRVLDDRFRYSSENCPISLTLEIVGERWTLLVLREAFYGVRRFDDFHRALGCARNLLTARLRTLVDHGIMRREPYREPGSRLRYDYRLTDKGIDLFPVLVALMQWGDTHLGEAAGPPVEIGHRGCGEKVEVELHCAAGHGHLSARDTQPRPGPGAKVAS